MGKKWILNIFKSHLKTIRSFYIQKYNNMFDQINIETLILKYLQGELTEGEQRELDEWLKDDRNKKLFSRLINKQRILVKM